MFAITRSSRPGSAITGEVGLMLADAPTYANGLVAGQYYAPIFDYIFPENIRPGDPPVAFSGSSQGTTTS